ncbi:unnamed protein product, partial [Symbiodinium sp. CCMP2456]
DRKHFVVLERDFRIVKVWKDRKHFVALERDFRIVKAWKDWTNLVALERDFRIVKVWKDWKIIVALEHDFQNRQGVEGHSQENREEEIMSVRVRQNTGGEGNSTRIDQVCWDLWAGREACVALVASRMKQNRLTAGSMSGREDDHSRG